MPERRLQNGSHVSAETRLEWGNDVAIGPDVMIRARRIELADRVRIGVGDGVHGFKYPGGVRIDGEELVLGAGVEIDRHVLIRGGRIELGAGVRIEPEVSIHVTRALSLGPHGVIRDRCVIDGVEIAIGRQFRMLPQATIGGGSAFEAHSRLRMGDWCHVGLRSFLNTARAIELGDEVGLGTGTCLYTHGAYPSVLEGKPAAYGPIRIGDRTWLPGAVVNPACTIGRDCVIGVGSVVTKDIPDGSLAAGVPARVLKANAYPRRLSREELLSFMKEFLETFAVILAGAGPASPVGEDEHGLALKLTGTEIRYYPSLPAKLPGHGEGSNLVVLTDASPAEAWHGPARSTCLGLLNRSLAGAATPVTERLLNQLRRYGIRFNYDAVAGAYRPWSESS